MPESGIIFRPSGRDSAKSLSLHRDSDWQTGLSFMDHPSIGASIRYNVKRLREAGYEVRFDGGQIARNVWTGEPYQEPNIKGQVILPSGHVSVFHPDRTFWDKWHAADAAYLHTSEVSTQTQALYDLRER